MRENKKVLISIFTIVIIIFIIFVVRNVSKKDVDITKIKESDLNYFVLKSNEKAGVINKNGDIIIDAKYDSIIIPNPTIDVFICKKGNDVIVLNNKSEKIFEKYKNIEPISTEGVISFIPYEKELLKYYDNGKYGLIDIKGKKITNAIYEEIKSLKYKEGYILVKKDGKYGVINKKGKTIIKPEYDQIEGDKFSEENFGYINSGYIAYKTTDEGYRYAYINYKGKTILKAEYNSIERITSIGNKDEQWLIVSKNGQYGVVKNGKNIIDFAYQKIEYNADNKLFLVNRNNKFGVLNKKGEQILDVKYQEIEFKGIYIYTKYAGEEKYYYADGKEADTNYKSISKTSNEKYYITVNKDNLYGVIDNNKNILISNKYVYMEFLFEKYFLAYDKQNGATIIDDADNKMLNDKYNSISKIGDFKLIKCEKTQNGKQVIEIFSNNINKITELEDANIDIYSNYIQLSNNNEIIYINSEGKIVTNKDIFNENNILTSMKNQKWGYVDKNNNVVLDYNYDYATELNSYGFAAINKDGKWGSIDKNGKIIVNPIYEFENDEFSPEFIGKYYKVYFGYGQFYYTDKN